VRDGQRINSIRAGWHGHPRVVGDDVEQEGISGLAPVYSRRR
jgi:hypothetical protein